MTWHGEGKRHEMSRRGVKTSQPQDGTMWFKSSGIIGEMLGLMEFLDITGDMEKMSAKGYTVENYKNDAKNIAILPVDHAVASVHRIYDEWKTANPQRKYELEKLAKLTKYKILQQINKTPPGYTKEQLEHSYDFYNDLTQQMR